MGFRVFRLAVYPLLCRVLWFQPLTASVLTNHCQSSVLSPQPGEAGSVSCHRATAPATLPGWRSHPCEGPDPCEGSVSHEGPDPCESPDPWEGPDLWEAQTPARALSPMRAQTHVRAQTSVRTPSPMRAQTPVKAQTRVRVFSLAVYPLLCRVLWFQPLMASVLTNRCQSSVRGAWICLLPPTRGRTLHALWRGGPSPVFSLCI